MTEVLDSLNTEYTDNIRDCLKKIKLLAVILQPPMTGPIFQQVEKVAEHLFSSIGQRRIVITGCRI